MKRLSAPSRRILNTAISFVAGFVLADIAIHLSVGDPFSLYAEYRSEKLALLKDTGPELCSAAFGSSHVHNGFDPRAFDSAIREQGIRITSINLAIEGGSQGEQYQMAQRFLAAATRRPGETDRCFVMLEANAGVNMQTNNFLNPRAINTYDGEVAGLSSKFLSSEFSWIRNLGRLSVIGAGTALYYGNTGMLASRIFPHALDATLLRRQSDGEHRGMLSEPPVAKEVQLVQELIASRPQQPEARPVALTRGHADLVAALMRKSSAGHFTFIYVVTPKLSDLAVTETYPSCLLVGRHMVPIINTAQPLLYPQLYRPELWHDSAHLNDAGAAVFSRILAGQIFDQLSPTSATSHCARL